MLMMMYYDQVDKSYNLRRCTESKE